MSGTAIPLLHRSVSGSKLVETLGESLSAIKAEDGLTDAELGKYLHKGVDAGKAYRTGYAEMPVTSFLRGCERWNGRFANDALSLIGMKLVPLHTAEVSDQSLQTRLSKLMFEVSVALEDGNIDDLEIARMKRTLIEAGEAIDCFRGKAA
ncbi:hypothetical protein [Sphingomonas xinjiangensis]|uniref:Uncharacterized protein n=1 Tax=Sphingomonas xinjiangensis TaxID=643568 RepID=A0A840YND3_9SPHN|nr:hypothetical protein [Sphingomonas xinjiangensis]MBB5709311.1 hypothetical protein [Sphingomonas xinjiangensis]